MSVSKYEYDPVSVEVISPGELRHTVSLADGELSVDALRIFEFTRRGVAPFALATVMASPGEIVTRQQFEEAGIKDISQVTRGFDMSNRRLQSHVNFQPLKILRQGNSITGSVFHENWTEGAAEQSVKLFEPEYYRPRTAEERVLLSPFEEAIRDFMRDHRGVAHTVPNIKQWAAIKYPDITEQEVTAALRGIFSKQDKTRDIFSDLFVVKQKDTKKGFVFGSRLLPENDNSSNN